MTEPLQQVVQQKPVDATMFRNNNKKIYDLAKRGPIIITRRRENFVLMSYQQFFNLANSSMLKPRGLPTGIVQTVVHFTQARITSSS